MTINEKEAFHIWVSWNMVPCPQVKVTCSLIFFQNFFLNYQRTAEQALELYIHNAVLHAQNFINADCVYLRILYKILSLSQKIHGRTLQRIFFIKKYVVQNQIRTEFRILSSILTFAERSDSLKIFLSLNIL